MKLLLFILTSLLLLTSCLRDYEPFIPPAKKSTKYFVYKSLTKKNGVITFTNIHTGTCTTKSYYEINQSNEVTYVSYSTCESYMTQKGTYSSPNGTMIIDGFIYSATINGDELTVSQSNKVMNDTYEEITVAQAKQ